MPDEPRVPPNCQYTEEIVGQCLNPATHRIDTTDGLRVYVCLEHLQVAVFEIPGVIAYV